jgi:hypothetical protein
MEEGLRWWKTGEEDSWAMGMKVRRSGVDGQDKWRVGWEKSSAGGRWLRFNGKRPGGGPRGWTPRGGRAEEREREGVGGLGATWSSAVACRRCGSGPAAVRTGGALPRDSGGWRGRRDAFDAADRWAGARQGPDRQWLGVTR